jgi:pyruvate-ferredoxin/flavodoxin oxidoreductase
MYGDRQMIANATGCTSIYSGSAPSTPYTTNDEGFGPAWANSLFEDNAEFGMGMLVATDKMRDRVQRNMEEAIAGGQISEELAGLFSEWIAKREDADATIALRPQIIALASLSEVPQCKVVVAMNNQLVKKSQWIIGGDGWAYDIGFGGLDHVIASGKNVNILVVDTEVYSNTGGQSSKSTPIGAIAKFAAAGKQIRKKDLALIATTYGYVYVAMVAMGSNQAQTLKAIREAEAYPGPSLVIAYSPCIAHGLVFGMGKAQEQCENAVECGYWNNWRYNPALEAEGKNPFILDSKEPNWDKFDDFLKSEIRYTSLSKQYPAEALELFTAAKQNAKKKWANLVRLSTADWSLPVE